MNFRISVDNEINENSCGELIYKEDGIQIESEFQQAIVRKNSSGTVICLGKVKVKNKLKSIDIYFNEINKNSFQSVNQDLEGRFILVLIVGTSLFICSDQFGKLDILFMGDYIENDPLVVLEAVLSEGYDTVLVDSFAEVAVAVVDYHGGTMKNAETKILNLLDGSLND